MYDKQYVQFQAITGISLFYCIVIFPITIILYTRIARKNYLYSNKFEMWVGIAIAIIALILITMQAFISIGPLFLLIFMDINLYSSLELF